MDILKEMEDIATLVPVAEFVLAHEPEELISDPEIGELVLQVVCHAVEGGAELTEESVAREILYLPKRDRFFLLQRLSRL